MSIELVREFVRVICKDREPSHGYEHMNTVCNKALSIYDALYPERSGSQDDSAVIHDIMVVALLHDVADHKYDTDGTLLKRLTEFLETHFPEKSVMILGAINAISYSKEHKLGRRWFQPGLGPHWSHIRDIVSDADKLEALGVIGVDRCMHYATEIGADDDESILVHLLTHMDLKLLGLKEYIVTEPAKGMAVGLLDQMIRKTFRVAIDVLQNRRIINGLTDTRGSSHLNTAISENHSDSEDSVD